jgi:hypothetical protein
MNLMLIRIKDNYHELMSMGPCIIVQFIKKNSTRCSSASHFIIPYLYEAQHVSGDTSPIIRSLKLHWHILCLTTSTNYTYKQPFKYEKPEAASAVFGS